MSRFDYVRYGTIATVDQQYFKDLVTRLESSIEKDLVSPQAKALALTKLEECYMWIGKAIRDDQIARDKKADLQEERSDS